MKTKKDTLTLLREDFVKHAAADVIVAEAAITRDTDMAKATAAIQASLDALDKKIEPIVATYVTVGSLGKWTMTILVSVSLMVGIVWGIIQIIIGHKTP